MAHGSVAYIHIAIICPNFDVPPKPKFTVAISTAATITAMIRPSTGDTQKVYFVMLEPIWIARAC